jgi:hypothetical protein
LGALALSTLWACVSNPVAKRESEPAANSSIAATVDFPFLLRAAGCAYSGWYEQLLSEKAVLRCPEGFSAVEIAAVANRTWVIEALHAFNPEASAARADGFGPFHLAALHGSLDALEALARLRPDELDRPCATGRTPLHFAAISGEERAFARLVELGADPQRPDAAGMAPEQYLERRHVTKSSRTARFPIATLDGTSIRQLREWDGLPPRFAVWSAGSTGYAKRLRWAVWSDGVVLVDTTLDAQAPWLLVTRIAPNEVELALADLHSIGFDTIRGRSNLAMHGGCTRIDLWSGLVLSSTANARGEGKFWLPECGDPRNAWFSSVWAASAALLDSLASLTLHLLPRDFERPSFRGYRPDIPHETPWAIEPWRRTKDRDDT